MFNLIEVQMKRMILMPVILIITIMGGYGQRSVDALFDKYTGSEGFTAITISGDLIKLVRSLDDNEYDERCWPEDITTVRILAQDDDNGYEVNFYDLVEKELDRRNYEEFMRVKNAHQDMVMLVRVEGKKFKEFLVVAGGEDNALIQILGNMTINEAKRFSQSMKKDKGVNIIISCR
jgi:hypothetical protein